MTHNVESGNLGALQIGLLLAGKVVEISGELSFGLTAIPSDP